MALERIEWEETQQTPYIFLDEDESFLKISGKSYMENTFEFYNPVMEWLENYFKGAKKKVFYVEIGLIYFNSSSSKWLFDLFDLLDEACRNNRVEVYWHYDVDNESAKEAGEDFAAEFETLPIILKPFEEQ